MFKKIVFIVLLVQIVSQGQIMVNNSYAQTTSNGVFNPVITKLDNGLTVAVISHHRSASVVHMLWYKVGAIDEPLAKSGIAHFLEHLMFKGTNKIAEGEFSKTVSAMGGQDNAMTSSDFTAYYQQVHKKFLPNVMEMEADRMVNLVLSENAVATERKVILEERSSVIDSNPQRLFMEEMYSNLFRNHPYKTPIIGWRHEMETLSKQDALDFYKRFYAPNNAILVISGDVEAEEAIKLAEEKYGHIPANNNISPAIEWAEPDILSKRTFVMTNTQANLPFLQRSYQLPSYATGKSDHELLSLQVLSYILGGYDNSIIYNKLVRDTGLASYTSINYDASRRGSSLLSISVVPIEDDEESIDKIINIIDETLAHTQITADRLRVAKKSLLADSVYARDGYMGGAMLIGEALALNLDIDVVEKWPEAISKITLEDVQNSLDKLAKRDDHVTGLLKLAE